MRSSSSVATPLSSVASCNVQVNCSTGNVVLWFRSNTLTMKSNTGAGKSAGSVIGWRSGSGVTPPVSVNVTVDWLV
ncbi:hypothetical protein D3C86_2097870 [compost metagenome]